MLEVTGDMNVANLDADIWNVDSDHIRKQKQVNHTIASCKYPDVLKRACALGDWGGLLRLRCLTLSVCWVRA